MSEQFRLAERNSRLVINAPFIYTMFGYSGFLILGVTASLAYDLYLGEWHPQNWYRMFPVTTPFNQFELVGYLVFSVYSVMYIFCGAISLSNSLNLFASPLFYVDGFCDYFSLMFDQINDGPDGKLAYGGKTNLINAIRLQNKIHV